MSRAVRDLPTRPSTAAAAATPSIDKISMPALSPARSASDLGRTWVMIALSALHSAQTSGRRGPGGGDEPVFVPRWACGS